MKKKRAFDIVAQSLHDPACRIFAVLIDPVGRGVEPSIYVRRSNRPTETKKLGDFCLAIFPAEQKFMELNVVVNKARRNAQCTLFLPVAVDAKHRFIRSNVGIGAKGRSDSVSQLVELLHDPQQQVFASFRRSSHERSHKVQTSSFAHLAPDAGTNIDTYIEVLKAAKIFQK
ncbi:MAG TPA: hypothetical protein VE986_10080 [Hyphomicrobiales bacterium]|nr:hypothetical protein [Hyphomicrobiales bacterium]